jgi:signal transduction histidine kinase/ActR/RegA family two-component response regulator
MDERVLIWALGRDGFLTREFLGEIGFDCRVCSSWEELRAEMEAGVGAVILAAELLSADIVASLEAVLAKQPPWSDLPLIIVTRSELTTDGAPNPFEALGNVALLHRPLSLDTLTSTVRTALRARRRQYQVRDLIRQREEANRRKDEFLAMLAHELRNPLAPIRTGLQVLRRASSEEMAERTRQMMERQLGNLARLVDDLLDVSRITRGKITLRKRVLDVGAVLGQTVAGLAPLAAEKGHILDVSTPDEPILAELDPTRLEQMIGNVLGNAIKFTPPNGLIQLSIVREGPHAVIRVRDTGVGIPPSMLGQVFELFAQTERPLDRSQGGLGIGLTVVRSLAELHGGAAEIFSEGDGQGTEVVIRLPVLDQTAPLTVPPPRDRASGGGRAQRILIIEDNRDSAELLAMCLGCDGHEVVIAHDGPAGVAAARRDRPSVIICDIGLPGMNGYQVVKTLRAEPGFESCLFLAVTGYGDDADRDRAREAGFNWHLTKPVDPEGLAGLVAHWTGATAIPGAATVPLPAS